MITVSNTTPIISLLKAEALEILERLFGEVYISQGVYNELVSNNVFIEEAQTIKECRFIKVVNVRNEFAVKLLQKNLALDLGESEAIVLSDELNGDILIIDEKKGRAVAKSMSINLAGTLGVLLKAKNQGIVEAIRPIIDKMMQKDIRISATLYEEVLKKAKEY